MDDAGRVAMNDKSILSNLQEVQSFDFNLLVVFETIFVYGSVKLAGEKLGMSSSSVSQALTRIRTYFHDPLFIREGQKIVPTTVATNLHESIGNEFGGLVNKVINFNKCIENNKFIVYSSPYIAMRLLPGLYAAIKQSDLSCNLVHMSADTVLNAGEDVLAYRKADIVFDTHHHYSFTTVTKLCLRETVVAVCRKDHPRLGNILTFEDVQNEATTFLNVNTLGLKEMQKSLGDSLEKRDISFTSGSVIVNAAISAASDAISFVPQWFADKHGANMGLKTLICQFPTEPIDLYVSYNKSALSNANFVQLLELIESIIIQPVADVQAPSQS